MRATLFAAALLCGPSAGAPAQAGPALRRALVSSDSLIAGALGTRFPGAVFLVARNGRTLHLRGFGAVRRETLFDLASVTKVMATTFAIMLLVDRHLVDLDAPVFRYLPAFRGVHLDSITIRHLLNHSSGLEPWQPLYYHATNSGEAFEVIRGMPLKWGVGEARHYSDLGFMLLGYVVERVSGRPLDRFLDAELYRPLGLRHTAFNPKEHGFKEFAATEEGNGYERQMVYDPNFGYDYAGDPKAWDGWRSYVTSGETNDGNSWYAHGGVAGHAGLFSTAADLGVLLQLLLDGGSHAGRRFLRPETIRRFLTRDLYQHYLGWQVPDSLPEGSFAHPGFTGTYVLGVPKYGLSVVLLTNRQRMGRDPRGFFPDLGPLQRAVAKRLSSAVEADARSGSPP
ncbi:MAG TPA: serine hydrolase [Gemmatimonadales bacterium]|nr:serine hydrolase [Gemmatimonadales bacterium]